MARELSYFGVSIAAIAAVAALSACSKDTGVTSPDATGGAAGIAGAAGSVPMGNGGMIGNGGMTGSGGMIGMGGMTGTGGATGGAAGASTGGSAGSTMSMDAGILGYVCEENLPKIDPGGMGAADSACCNGAGKCALATSVMAMPGASGYGHDTCKKTAGATDLLCAPLPEGDASAATAGLYATCTAQIGPTGFEGRCLPKCFVAGTPNSNNLTMGTCKAGSLNLVCAPCYNPVDGKASGACSVAPNDKPKMPAPMPYPKCGARDAGAPLGTCVPKTVALASGNPAAPSLKQDDCSTADYVCTPTLKSQNSSACFVKCLTGLNGSFVNGACVPIYVASDVSPSALAFVHQTTCQTGEVCAPCEDLLSPGHPSHACQ